MTNAPVGGNMTNAPVGGNMTNAPNSSSLLQDTFKLAKNSVVQITSNITNPNVIIVNGKLLGGNNTLSGAGFIYDAKGRIITSTDVVPDTSNNTNKVVDVAFTDGNTYQAKVIGRDPFSSIAVLQLIGNFSDERLLPLSITNSSNLQVGQPVIAIGNPYGLSSTMTVGIVTKTARLLPNPDIGFSMPIVIQTDVVFAPGDAGGPLLNMQGQVIGMNNIGILSNGTFSGIAFAVPSNTLSRIVPSLIQTGSYAHPWLGISGSSITPQISQSTGIPRDYKGVMVNSVEPGSPAEKATLRGISHDKNNMTQIGDIIIAIDGHNVKQFEDILSYLEMNKSVGDSVKITVNRDGQIMYRTAILQAMPQLPPLLP
jgi:S1-C subfamily serine protease